MVLYISVNKMYRGKAGENAVMAALRDYGEGIYTEKQLADEKIIRTEQGKPLFKSLPVKFSVSHTGSIWGCLMADFNVGLDLQLDRKVNHQALANRFFSEEEKAYVNMAGKTGFFRIWTRKEAFVKYTGEGLFRQGTDSFSTSEYVGGVFSLKNKLGEAFMDEINLDDYSFFQKAVLWGAICSSRKENITIKELPI